VRIERNPTEFADLNHLLVELAETALGILGDNMVGAYLQGSFALGDADRHSDVDFLIPTREPVAPAEEAALRVVHAGFPQRPEGWARHLEGSYPPAGELRTLAAAGCSWLYVDNGATDIERSPHCNTAFVRWSLRERGVLLAGPEPKALVDPVPPEALRAQAARDAARFMPLLPTWTKLDTAWTQPYVVMTFCRLLYTLESGAVASKREALLWAAEALDPEWSPLIVQALADRPDPWRRVHEPARPGSVEATERFARYATALAATWT